MTVRRKRHAECVDQPGNTKERLDESEDTMQYRRMIKVPELLHQQQDKFGPRPSRDAASTSINITQVLLHHRLCPNIAVYRDAGFKLNRRGRCCGRVTQKAREQSDVGGS